jgi:hypothetical protein
LRAASAAQRPRIAEIRQNLRDRIAEAEREATSGRPHLGVAHDRRQAPVDQAVRTIDKINTR